MATFIAPTFTGKWILESLREDDKAPEASNLTRIKQRASSAAIAVAGVLEATANIAATIFSALTFAATAGRWTWATTQLSQSAARVSATATAITIAARGVWNPNHAREFAHKTQQAAERPFRELAITAADQARKGVEHLLTARATDPSDPVAAVFRRHADAIHDDLVAEIDGALEQVLADDTYQRTAIPALKERLDAVISSIEERDTQLAPSSDDKINAYIDDFHRYADAVVKDYEAQHLTVDAIRKAHSHIDTDVAEGLLAPLRQRLSDQVHHLDAYILAASDPGATYQRLCEDLPAIIDRSVKQRLEPIVVEASYNEAVDRAVEKLHTYYERAIADIDLDNIMLDIGEVIIGTSTVAKLLETYREVAQTKIDQIEDEILESLGTTLTDKTVRTAVDNVIRQLSKDVRGVVCQAENHLYQDQCRAAVDATFQQIRTSVTRRLDVIAETEGSQRGAAMREEVQNVLSTVAEELVAMRGRYLQRGSSYEQALEELRKQLLDYVASNDKLIERLGLPTGLAGKAMLRGAKLWSSVKGWIGGSK